MIRGEARAAARRDRATGTLAWASSLAYVVNASIGAGTAAGIGPLTRGPAPHRTAYAGTLALTAAWFLMTRRGARMPVVLVLGALAAVPLVRRGVRSHAIMAALPAPALAVALIAMVKGRRG